jgi:biotin operon repressor
MQASKTEERALDRQLDEICDGFREAIDREVETLQREGLPIYVADNGRVVDLQTNKPPR